MSYLSSHGLDVFAFNLNEEKDLGAENPANLFPLNKALEFVLSKFQWKDLLLESFVLKAEIRVSV